MSTEPNYATGPVDWEATAEMWKERAEALQKVARASVRRLEKAAQYCGDPQHPIWDGGRVSDKARQRVEGLLDILDPFRPELEDVDEDDWDRVYKLDPIDGYVSDFEERMEARAFAAESERDALRAQLDTMIPEWHTTRAANGAKRVQKRLVGPWMPVEEPTS